MRTGGLPRAVSVDRLASGSDVAVGLGLGGLRPLLRLRAAPNQWGCSTDNSIAQNVRRCFSDRTNCISLVLSPRACSSLKSAANYSSSNFIRADAQKYPPSSGSNKAEWNYDPDGRPGIWVPLFWFQHSGRTDLLKLGLSDPSARSPSRSG